MKFEASVEISELEGFLYKVLNKKMYQIDIKIVFNEKEMTDCIKVIDQNGETVFEKSMEKCFELLEEALFNDSVKLKITSYEPTEEGFVFELSQ